LNASYHNEHQTINTPSSDPNELLPELPAEAVNTSTLDRRSFLMRNAVIGAAS
jgi:hypothetical protein